MVLLSKQCSFFLLFIKNNYLLDLYIPENSVSARKSSEYSQYWLQIIGILINYVNYYFDWIVFSNIISILFYFWLHVRGLTMNCFFCNLSAKYNNLLHLV